MSARCACPCGCVLTAGVGARCDWCEALHTTTAPARAQRRGPVVRRLACIVAVIVGAALFVDPSCRYVGLVLVIGGIIAAVP